MNFIFRVISGETAIVAADTIERATEIMQSIFGEQNFEIAS